MTLTLFSNNFTRRTWKGASRAKENHPTCGAEERRNGSLSGFIISLPTSSAEAQCQALMEDPSITMMACTARFSLAPITQTKKKKKKFTSDRSRTKKCTAPNADVLTSFWWKMAWMSWIFEDQAEETNSQLFQERWLSILHLLHRKEEGRQIRNPFSRALM